MLLHVATWLLVSMQLANMKPAPRIELDEQIKSLRQSTRNLDQSYQSTDQLLEKTIQELIIQLQDEKLHDAKAKANLRVRIGRLSSHLDSLQTAAPAPRQPVEQAPEPESGGPPGAEPVISIEPDLRNSKRITLSIVDPVATGDNYYRGGSYEFALAVYQRIDLSDYEKEDRAWVNYQIANCLRHLGDPTASNKYREIIDTSGVALLTKLSRWWLNALDKEQNLRRTLVELKDTEEQFREVLNELNKHPSGN